MFWCFRCVRNLIGAIVALAAVLALTEVGLRLARATNPVAGAPLAGSFPLVIPSTTTGWELQPAARHAVSTDDGQTIDFHTNSLGLRSNNEVVVPKPAGMYRIVCLGDEALLAATIAEDATLPLQIQRRLQSTTRYGIEVLNAGLPRGCPETAAIHYRQTLSALQPDLVILHVHADDVADHAAIRKWVVRDRQGQTLVCAHPDLRSPPRELPVALWRREFAVVDWVWHQGGQRWVDAAAGSTRLQRTTAAAIEDMLSPIEVLSSLCSSTPSAFVVCLAPASETELNAPGGGDAPFARTAFDWLSERRIAVVDGASVLEPRLDFLATSSGWSAAGHARLADFLAMQIVHNLQGPWSSSSAPASMVPVSHAQPAAEPSRVRLIR